MDEKLQKVLARAGLGSRRAMEVAIADGRVRVNGEPAHLGMRVGPKDQIQFDGRALHQPRNPPTPRALVYHKPEGEICTRDDPEGRPSVFDALPQLRNGRWISVGRLDINSSGLMIFTTDGELANRLMHPSSEIEREYAVRVLGEVTPEQLGQMRRGVELEDGPAAFDDIRLSGGEGANRWYHVLLREGRYREVRRIWDTQGVQVSRLTRVRFGAIRLPRDLPAGRFRYLEPIDMQRLYRMGGLPLPTKRVRQRGAPSARGRDGRRPRR